MNTKIGKYEEIVRKDGENRDGKVFFLLSFDVYHQNNLHWEFFFQVTFAY
jgi:hypothetical protein